MTKTCLIIVTIQKTHHIIVMLIRRLSVNSKDEVCNVPIVEFVGLKSKMYSYIKSDEKVERPLRVLKRMSLRTTSSTKTTKTCY